MHSLSAVPLHSLMDLESNNSVKRYPLDEEVAAYRKRYNKLVVAFKFFFISLTLSVAATITYLVILIQPQSSEHSLHLNPSTQISNPITTTESEIFYFSLQNSAQELDDAASLIISNYSDAAFASCGKWLENGSEQLREAIRVNPVSRPPAEKQRIEMANRVAAAERDIESCLADLTAESSESAYEMAERVYRAAAKLSRRGDFLMTRRKRILRKLRESVWDVVVENLIIICLFGFQMVFIAYLFWKIFNI